MSLRAVLDTNVILASRKAQGDTSPNREIIQRWLNGEFLLLFSLDVLDEYAEKLLANGIPKESVTDLLAKLYSLGELVPIEVFHLHHYPEDSDDVCFLLCAVNGNATHLLTYDNHLLILEGFFPFTIGRPLDFLNNLRADN